MTQRQIDLLRFIERFQAERDGLSPSLDEMAEGIGLAAKSGAHRLVEALVEMGRLRRSGHARGYEVLPVVSDLASAADGDLLAEVARRGLLRGAA